METHCLKEHHGTWTQKAGDLSPVSASYQLFDFTQIFHFLKLGVLILKMRITNKKKPHWISIRIELIYAKNKHPPPPNCTWYNACHILEPKQIIIATILLQIQHWAIQQASSCQQLGSLGCAVDFWTWYPAPGCSNFVTAHQTFIHWWF